MLFDVKPADAYHKAVKRLQKSEQAHRLNIDALSAAIEARNTAKVMPARRDCEKSERELSESLQTAFNAHRAYWCARRDELLEELDQAATVIREFNALARAAGDTGASPALQRIQNLLVEQPRAEPLVEDVPVEQPDSLLLEDERGVWRA